jgi:type IV pilus assembly protein PilW
VTRQGAVYRRRGAGRRGAQGFSLVELMVSLTIGVAVVGALLAAYLAASQSRSNTEAVNQMTDDASIALQILRQQVAQAGYRQPAGGGASGFRPLKPAIFGCNGGTGFGAGTQGAIDALGACGAATAGPDWLAVSYQVEVEATGAQALGNAVLAPDRVPYDCAGNTLAPVDGAFIADSHFYVARPTTSNRTALYCRQGGTSASVPGQPVAENVVDFQVQYLLAAAGAPRQAAYYSDAPDTTPAPGSKFDDVVAVRLCVEVTSTLPLADRNQPQSFLNCANLPVAPTDGYLHRAFTTTVTLQNRV